MIPRTLLALTLLAAPNSEPTVRAAVDRPGIRAPVTAAEIKSAIRELGDPSYETRTTATRRLCAAGNRARKLLSEAAEGPNMEVALRAKQLLSVFDQLWFAGVEVRLAFNKQTITWDEPVSLSVSLTNGSAFPARVPFELKPAGDKAVTPDAVQVATMLDLADFLQVFASDGRSIELRVDDIEAEPAVADAVARRLEDSPATVIEPGGTLTITAPEFNRGWARYRLLDEGKYTVRLVYEPNWDDEVLAALHVGRVTSKPAVIRVNRSAPATVSRGGAEASVTLERSGPMLIAGITNRTDQEMLVNKNFGASVPFAVGHWVYTSGDSMYEATAASKPAADWHDFDAKLLVAVPPGESVELARVNLSVLLDAFRDRGADMGDDTWTVHFAYVSFLDRHWQRRQGNALLGNADAPELFRRPLSRRILSARHASNRIVAPRAE